MKTFTIIHNKIMGFLFISMMVFGLFNNVYSQDNGEVIIIWNGEDVSPDWIPIAIDGSDLNNNASNPKIGDTNPSLTVMSVNRKADGPPWAGAMLQNLSVSINIQTFQMFTLMIYKEVIGRVQLELQFENYNNIHLNVENTVINDWELIEFYLPQNHLGVDATIKNILVAPHQHETEGDENFHAHTMFWDHVQAHEFTVTNLEDDLMSQNPIAFELEQNYPNPFNPVTQIVYSLPHNSHVKIDVYNAIGHHVETLVNTERGPGEYSVSFNASGLSSGIYFYQLRSEGTLITRKMSLIK